MSALQEAMETLQKGVEKQSELTAQQACEQRLRAHGQRIQALEQLMQAQEERLSPPGPPGILGADPATARGPNRCGLVGAGQRSRPDPRPHGGRPGHRDRSDPRPR